MIWWIIGIIAVMLILIVVLLYLETKKFKVTEYVYKSPKANDEGVRVCLLSDMHGHKYGVDNEAVLEAIDAAKPDIIICAGDMITAKEGQTFKGIIHDGIFRSDNASYESAINFMKKLADKYPVFLGNGNHESRLYRQQNRFDYAYNDFRKAIESIGVTLLADDMRTIPIHGNILNIFGIDIAGEYYRRFERIKMPKGYMEVKLGKLLGDGIDETNLNLLIAHNPDYFEQYAAWGADLSFAGHIHGGVLRLGNRGVISPQFHLFPKYSGGMYETNGKAMVVSCGLGHHSMPIRIHDRAEIVIVNIVKG